MSKHLDAQLQREADRLGRVIGGPPQLWHPRSSLPSRHSPFALLYLLVTAGTLVALLASFTQGHTDAGLPEPGPEPGPQHATDQLDANSVSNDRFSPAAESIVVAQPILANRPQVPIPSSEQELALVESAAERGETNVLVFEATPTE